MGSNGISIFIHACFQSYLCLPLDVVLFSIYNVFKVAYRPDGPSVESMLITTDIYTLQKVYMSLLINKLLTLITYL